MSIFTSIFRSRDKPQDRTAGSGYSFFMGSSTSGKQVTERSAMQMTAVYAPELKIDVYDQLKMNWDHFVDYVWQFAPKKRPRTKEGVVDEL